MGNSMGGKCVILSLAVVFLLLSVSGCGIIEDLIGEEAEEAIEEALNDEENGEEVNGEEEAEEEEEEDEVPVEVDEWRNPTSMSEFTERFEEMKWTWAQIKDGEKTDESVFSYRCEGSDTVDGMETELIALILDDEKFKLWVDDAGDVVQVETGGEVIPGEFIDTQLDSVLNAAFGPFMMIEQTGIREFVSGSYPGVDWTTKETGTEQFGDMSAEVTRMEVEVGPPMTEEGEEGTAIWSVGDFGDFQMLVEWGWAEEATGDFGVAYELNQVKAR